MNQNEQMRELCPSCRNADIYACTCPFKTARNSQPECFEPAKLVRLTDHEIWSDDGIMSLNADLGLTFDEISQLANAIMDALIAKNGGKP